MIKQRISEELDKIRENNKSGAREFINKALNVLRIQLNEIENPDENITSRLINLEKEIIETRPSMAPLIYAMSWLLKDSEIITKEYLNAQIKEFVLFRNKIKNELENFFRVFLKNHYTPGLKVMLLSYSSTINDLLMMNGDLEMEFYVLESRPLLEGIKTAEILSQRFKTTLIIDAAMGKYINEIDMILVGMDSILKNGAIINKIGTFPLSVIAREHKIPIYGVGESLKYNLKSHLGQEIKIVNKNPGEVHQKNIKSNLFVENYYFDITPAKYIKGIISDLGLLEISDFLDMIVKKIPLKGLESLF